MPTESPPDDRSPIDVVLAWQAAASARDTQRVLELSDENVELAGPRGGARGHEILRDWLERTGIELETQRVFARGATVVVEQTAAWKAIQGTFTRAFIATLFEVQKGRVCRAHRYETLATALEAAGLSDADRKQP